MLGKEETFKRYVLAKNVIYGIKKGTSCSTKPTSPYLTGGFSSFKTILVKLYHFPR